MKKFLKWASIGLLVIGIIVGGIGVLTGGIDKADFLYFRDFAADAL